jgi:hypothetical protein
MRLTRGWVFLAILGFCPQEGPKKVYFEAPKDAKEEDLTLAAKALGQRLNKYGYVGMTAIIETLGTKKVVSVSSETPMTPQVIGVTSKLGQMPATSVELRVSYVRSVPEMQQFPSPAMDKLKTGAAPTGTEWIQCMGDELDKSPTNVALLKLEPKIKKSDLTVQPPKVQGGYSSYRISDAAHKKLETGSGVKPGQNIQWDGYFLVIDGLACQMHYNAAWVYEGKGLKLQSEMVFKSIIDFNVFDLIIRNPMPFPLTLTR